MDDVILDPAADLERLGPLRAALAAHDWAAVRRVLDAAAPTERTLLVLAAEPTDPEGFLGHVLGRDPDDSGAAALLAQHLTAAAWRTRGDAPAAYVGQERLEAFEEGLRRAEWVLIEAVARRPDDPALWVVRLATARGLGLDASELRRRYDRLAALDRAHLPGQSELLQGLCPTWGGTWPAALAFAQECVAAAPAGSLNPVVVVQAHVERWLELRDADSVAAEMHVTSDAVRAEVTDAAQRSVWHPDFVPGPGWVRALSTFAFAFSLQGDQRAAADLFSRLGPLASAEPWRRLGDDPAAIVREHRARALAEVAR